MLRVLIGTGVLLMAVGFGAAGWQYWQSLPDTGVAAVDSSVTAPDAAPAPVVANRQGWMISPSGGLVPPEDVRDYLAQEAFAPKRTVLMTRQGRLVDLLAEGETLPEAEYLQVLADIRAPRVAEGLCAVLVPSFAADCAVNAARVVEGSVDPVAGTALFRLELAYRLAKEDEELPDLATHVLQSDVARLTLEPGTEASASAEAALAAALTAATEACAAETVGKLCRTMQISVDWIPGQPVEARAEIAWLDPLPKGIFAAPPLTPEPGQ